MLLPETLSPAVLQGEPGAGATGKETPHQPHQEAARLGGVAPANYAKVLERPLPSSAQCERGRPGTQCRGLGSGSTGPVSCRPAKLKS